jgi:hypothetical protein
MVVASKNEKTLNPKECIMPAIGKTTFKGQSGAPYRFKVFPLGTRFRKLSGVYVVAHRGRDDDGRMRHAALYVGQTADFSEPLSKHHKSKDFADHGANCICVQSDKLADSRVKKQQDLLASLNPKCNG